jgi:hypothetical protein
MRWNEAARAYPEAYQIRVAHIEQSLLAHCRTVQRAFAMGDNELASILEGLADWFSLSEGAMHFEPTKTADWCLAQMEERSP